MVRDPLTSMGTAVAPTPTVGLEGSPPRLSRVGVIFTAAMLLLGSVAPLATILVVLSLGTDVAAEYPSLGLVGLALPAAASFCLLGTLGAALTFWPARPRLGKAVLVVAAVPWIAAAVASTPFIVTVCLRDGGACG